MAAMIPGGTLSPDGRSIAVRLVPGTPETGLWCSRCLLPSGIRVPVHALTATGPRKVTEVTACTDCGLRL
jgi:hypothetical protein